MDKSIITTFSRKLIVAMMSPLITSWICEPRTIVVISFVVNIRVNTQTNWFVLNMSLFKGIFAQYILKMNYGQINNYDLFPISVASFMAFVILMFFIRSDKNQQNLILLIFLETYYSYLKAFLALILVCQARLLVGLSVLQKNHFKAPELLAISLIWIDTHW